MKPKKPAPKPVRDMFAPVPSIFPALLLGVDMRDQAAARSQVRHRSSNWTVNRQRIAEIVKLIEHRHGGPCDTDDASLYLVAALPALIEEAGGIGDPRLLAQVTDWAWHAVPPVSPAEIQTAIAEARQRNADGRLHLSASEVGEILRLTLAERSALGIRSIRPAGMTGDQFEAYQRSEATAREQARRIRNGSIARKDSKAAMLRQLVEELGMSESTIKRKFRSGELIAPWSVSDRDPVSCRIEPTALKGLNTDLGQTEEPTVPGPARKVRSSRSGGADGHAPGGKTKAVRRGRAVAMPLPGGEGWTRGDIVSDGGRIGSVSETALACLRDYEGGPMTSEQRLVVRDWLRRAGWTHEQFGRLIGLSRGAVTNAIRENGSDGFGREAAANIRKLALAA